MDEFPIHCAAGKGKLKTVKHLIEQGISAVLNCRYSEDGSTPLHWAAQEGRYNVVDFLIRSGCNVNLTDRHGYTPVMLAATMLWEDVVDLLLQHGVKINVMAAIQPAMPGEKKLNESDGEKSKSDTEESDSEESDTSSNNSDIPDLSSESKVGMSSGEVPFSLLHAASGYGWTSVVRRILESREVDVNAVNSDGETPLMLASRKMCDKVAALLIRFGADVNLRDTQNNTALHLAASYDDTRMVVVLLEATGLDLNPQDIYGETPLHKACRWGYSGVAMRLLVAGADINIRNNILETAIANVCMRHDWDTLGSGFFVGFFVHRGGAFFEDCDYVRISQDPDLKERFLTDVSLCSQCIVNKFNRQSLPTLYRNPHFARSLPPIGNFELSASQISEIGNFVKADIEKNTFCNVFEVETRPISLSFMCVRSLLAQDSAWKRSASQTFSSGSSPLKKPCVG